MQDAIELRVCFAFSAEYYYVIREGMLGGNTSQDYGNRDGEGEGEAGGKERQGDPTHSPPTARNRRVPFPVSKISIFLHSINNHLIIFPRFRRKSDFARNLSSNESAFFSSFLLFFFLILWRLEKGRRRRREEGRVERERERFATAVGSVTYLH